MEAKAKAGEEDLSMEEILHSIRKIIAEDGEEAPIPDAPQANGKEAQVSGSDVLELTELVELPAAPAAETQAANDDVLSKIDQVLVPEVPAAKPTPAPAPQAAIAPIPAPHAAMTPNDQAYIDSLLSSEAAAAAATAFKKALPADMPIPTTPSPTLRSGNTVEDLVMESLKPMIKSWLDANLPTIVERIVEREVRKLAH